MTAGARPAPAADALAGSLHELRRLGGPVYAALERSGAAMVVTDPRRQDNPIVFANAAFTRLTGYAAEEVVGRNCRFLQGPDTDRGTIAGIGQALREGRQVEAEILNHRRDGTPFWNGLSIAPVPDGAERPSFFLATQLDVTAARENRSARITPQARQEEPGQVSERLRLVLAASGAAAAFEWRVAENVIIGDAQFAAFHGLATDRAAAGVAPRDFFAPVHPDDRSRIRLAVGAVLRGAEVFSKEYRLVAAGPVRWVQARGRCAYDPDHRPIRFSGVLLDVTDQKRMEERLRVAQSAGGIGTFEHVDGYATVAASEQFCRLLGLQPARDLPVRTVNGVVHPGEPPVIEMTNGGEPGAVCQAEFRITRPDDGEVRWLMRRGECLRDAETASLRVSGVIYDITDAKRAEERLRTLNETLEARVEERTRERDRTWRLASVVMAVATAEGTLLAVNPAWTEVLGWEAGQTVGRSVTDFVAPEGREASAAGLQQLARGLAVRDFLNTFLTRDGQRRRISWTVVPEGGHLYGYGRDVTDQLATEEQLRQAQKMEAVGQLTGGLAHDFNNLLTGITGSLELLQARVAQGRLGSLQRYIAIAQGAAGRATALTHRLLAFSRRQTLAPRPTDANRLVADMEELIRRTVGPAIAVDTVLAAGLWPTLCDPNQLENALLNLCINARDAMPDGGRLTIETANTRFDERGARERDMAPGQYVAVCVSDTGTGMAPAVAARAFDPFFTTKPLGEGTGLGLSMIYGFAKQSGGQVRIRTELGQGTTMRLYLPRHWGEAQQAAPPSELADAPRAEAGETVLVVDDEPTVRVLVAEVLEDLGYAAVEAADGASGLQMLRSDARFDLLVTDVGLPGGMNGRQLADAARRLRPALKVLFITGYAENAVIGNAHLEPGMHVLTKPFAMEVLATRIKAIIREGA